MRFTRKTRLKNHARHAPPAGIGLVEDSVRIEPPVTASGKSTVHRLDDVVPFRQAPQNLAEILLHLPASSSEFLCKPKPFQSPQPRGMQSTIL